ncbi:MAG: glutathione S-transferase N-terminal domain-containing protein [Gammaproteobacteria bacterium]|nr:glutathione S-transferase N-terminal domain-containing protein [Gammaproteobacteria bacterium]
MDAISQGTRLELVGAPGSPYTRKMLAWLRFKRIPYAIDWSNRKINEGYPAPKVSLIPTFYLPDDNGEIEAVVDSTPIIKRLNVEFPARSTTPPHPITRFLSDLVEDYADEWLTKIMFHYRWAFEEDAKNAGSLLPFFRNIQVDDSQVSALEAAFTDRQINRLYVVGSNEVTRPIIEASYIRIIDILDKLVQRNEFVLGARPCPADFGIFGQFTQLSQIEPTSLAILTKRSQRVRAWVMRVEDLCGLEVADEDWFEPERAASELRDLLSEIGRTYVPVMLANAAAINEGKSTFEAEVDGERWAQPTFPYQAKCLQWVREAYFALESDDRNVVMAYFDGTGCENLI